MGGEREDVREHPAVGEHLRWIADCIDERLVEPALGDHRPGLLEEGGARRAKTGADRRDRLVSLDLEVVWAVRHGGVPHVHLPHETRQQRAQRRIVVDALDRQLDRRIELLLAQLSGALDDLADEPHVVLDQLRHQVHGSHLVSCRQPEAAGWMEMDTARSLQLDRAGGRAPRGRPDS